MIINFAPPQAGLPGQAPMTASVAGDTITIDGSAYALAAVPDGGEGIPQGDSPFVGPIRRIGGEIHCTILWRYDADKTRPADPLPTAGVTSGAVPAPVVAIPAVSHPAPPDDQAV